MLSADLSRLAQRLEEVALQRESASPMTLVLWASVLRDLAYEARALEAAANRRRPAQLPPDVVRLDEVRARRAKIPRPRPL